MVAHINEEMKEGPSRIMILTYMTIFSLIKPNLYYWFIDSAASTHVCGNQDLFETIEDILPITIETASGNTFKVNK